MPCVALQSCTANLYIATCSEVLVTDTSVMFRQPVLPLHSSYPFSTSLLISQWKTKETEPGLIANLVVATNYTAAIHHILAIQYSSLLLALQR